MISPGLVSVTFRQLSCSQIIHLAKDSGLKGIEWGGDVHIPHADIETARRVRRQMEQADLNTAAYGSYYQIGKSEQEGLSFREVLDTAEMLEAPLIRVWAGDRDAEKAGESYVQAVIAESRRIADMAADKGIQVAYEFHKNTLTNTATSCRQLLKGVNHPSLRTYWQPMAGRDEAGNVQDIQTILPWICGFHVFYWGFTHRKRHPLEAGRDHWIQYLKVLNRADLNMYGLLEFVKDDSLDSFQRDAETYMSLLNMI